MIRLRSIRAPASQPDARMLVITVAWLRASAALGQGVAIAVASTLLHGRLPLEPLTGAVILLAMASAATFWRLRQRVPIAEIEAILQLAFDLLMLGWVLHLTGGTNNPFSTLLLVPVALAAAALSVRGIAAIGLLAGAIYAVLVFKYVPLPDMPIYHGAGFHLNLVGMAVNFITAALLLAVFIGRLTHRLRAQRDAIARLRERQLRDEGILAVATQAAMAAHDLNTPLSTLRLLLPELTRDNSNGRSLQEDVDVLVSEVERCHGILERMVAYGRGQLAHDTETTTLGTYIGANVERFALLCPEANVVAHVDPALQDQSIEVAPGLAHALLNLLKNAYDASMENGSNVVTLAVDRHNDVVEFVIGDRGRGLPDDALPGLSGTRSSQHGLGMGLALARSTIERLRGEFVAEHETEGTYVHVRVPVRLEAQQ